MPLPQIEELFNEAKAKCDESFATSKLKEKPDSEWALDWYETQVAKALAFDERLAQRACKPVEKFRHELETQNA